MWVPMNSGNRSGSWSEKSGFRISHQGPKSMGMAMFKRTFARTIPDNLREPHMKMWDFAATRARKFTRTSPRTIPWKFHYHAFCTPDDTSRETPFREWNFAFQESFSELREQLREYLGTLPELREWPFHSESVFLKLGWSPGF